MPKALSLVLPWPDKRLSPNVRVHWRDKATASRRARRITSKLCMEAGLRRDFEQPLTDKTRVSLALTLYPPNKRRRDDDNLIAAFKPYRDALATHLLIDDSRFECRYALCGPASEPERCSRRLPRPLEFKNRPAPTLSQLGADYLRGARKALHARGIGDLPTARYAGKSRFDYEFAFCLP